MSRLLLIIGAMFVMSCEEDSGSGGVNREALLDPTSAAVNQQAPDEFKVEFVTTKGNFIIQVHREWAPIGADRFYSLVINGFYDEQRFFRAVANFVVQFGIHGDPAIAKAWSSHPQLNPEYHSAIALQDDPRTQSNTSGTIVYAKTNAPNSRSTQVFINLGANAHLDGYDFAPFGEVVEGLEIVTSLYNEYGDAPTSKQGEITQLGNAYLDENFPELDTIKSARIID